MRTRLVFPALWIVLNAGIAVPCSTDAHYEPRTMIRLADIILRGRAVAYSGPPATPRTRLDGWLPPTNVQFLVEEVVKGSYDKSEYNDDNLRQFHHHKEAGQPPITATGQDAKEDDNDEPSPL
jgi:hypothetical protein